MKKVSEMKLLFLTDPHSAQGVYDADEDSAMPTHNKLHCVEDDQGRFVNMTGEELTSLANQWLSPTAKIGPTTELSYRRRTRR